MNEPKPFASLTSGLLARKGAARPAMRPQFLENKNASLEDLGWNDMGEGNGPYGDLPEHVPSSIAGLTPAPRQPDAEMQAHDIVAPLPPVVEQQRAIEAHFGEAPEMEDEAAREPAEASEETVEPAAENAELSVVDLGRIGEVVPLPPRPREQGSLARGKAAFTLRLDEDRHLRLRLATAVQNRSAQRIVTDALDTYLNALPELDTLAQQVPARRGKRS